MRMIQTAIAGILTLLAVATASAQVPQFPQTLPANTVIGRLGIGPGPSQAIPFATLLSNISGVQSANRVYAGPTTGVANIPTFRLLVPADLAALLSSINTWTGAQSYTDGTLILLGLTSGSTTLKAPATGGGTATIFTGTDTFVGRATTDTLTNKTISGASNTLSNIPTTALTGTLQAGQEPAHTGDCTNSAGSLALTCLNTNGVAFTTNATAAVGQLPGTTTNDNAAAGKVGEFFSPSVVAGSPIALTTATPLNLTSQSLTAGDWDVTCEANFSPAASTSITSLITSISTTSATLNQTPFNVGYYSVPAQVPGVVNISTPFPRNRVSLSATTTVFCVVQGTFTVSTLSVWGGLLARRVR